MTLPEAQGWVLIIGTLTTSILSLIAMLTGKKVHTLVNSAMTEQKTENAMLKSILVAKQLEIDSAEKARVALATALGHGPQTPIPVQVVAAEPVPVQVVEPKESG